MGVPHCDLLAKGRQRIHRPRQRCAIDLNGHRQYRLGVGGEGRQTRAEQSIARAFFDEQQVNGHDPRAGQSQSIDHCGLDSATPGPAPDLSHAVVVNFDQDKIGRRGDRCKLLQGVVGELVGAFEATADTGAATARGDPDSKGRQHAQQRQPLAKQPAPGHLHVSAPQRAGDPTSPPEPSDQG
jgi:hypothetical protein